MSDEERDDLGPDERDMDLLDGGWEERYYSGQLRQRDWRSIRIGISLVLLIALLLVADETIAPSATAAATILRAASPTEATAAVTAALTR